MLSKLSKKMTHFYLSKNKIEEDECEIYDYCFEIFLSTVLNLITVIIIGFACLRFLETTLFIAVFLTVRVMAGGYHSDTHFRCLLLLVVVFSIFLIMLYFVPVSILVFINLISSLIAMIVVAILSPIDHPNNQMVVSRKNKAKFVSISISIVCILIINILTFYHYNIIAFSIAYPLSAVAISCIAGVIKNKSINCKGGSNEKQE